MWVLWWWHMSIQVHCNNKEAIFMLEVRLIPGLSKAWQSRFSVKTMLIVFFSCWHLVLCVFVPRGETVNQELYLTIGWCLQKAVWKKWQEHQQEHCCLSAITLLHTHASFCPEVSHKIVVQWFHIHPTALPPPPTSIYLSMELKVRF